MMTDPLNDIEGQIVNLLQGDGGYPTSTITEVLAGNIHEKFRDDLRTYYGHELPAIGVMSFGMATDDDGQTVYDVALQVVAMGGTLADLDEDVKTIVAKIVRLLQKQNEADGTCLLGTAERISDINGQIVHGTIETDDDYQLAVLGEVNCKVTVYGE